MIRDKVARFRLRRCGPGLGKVNRNLWEKGGPGHVLRGVGCEGENSLKPQASISLNYRAKGYLALLPSFYELHASVLENTTFLILEISLLLREVCFHRFDRFTWNMVHF